MKETWERLLRWCNEHIQPDVFNPPLSQASGPLAPLHQLANGQALDRAIFERFHLLSAEGCTAQKTMLDGLAKKESWPATWWSLDWHPFAEDITGGLLVLDAKTGEVIEFLHDDDARPLLGTSLEDWLSKFVARLESGALIYDAKVGVVERDFHEKLAAQRAKRVAREPSPESVARGRKVFFTYLAICILIALAFMAWSTTHG